MKILRRTLLYAIGSLLFFSIESLLNKTPSFAASQITVRYGILEQSLPVSDLRKYAETGKVSSDLQSFLNYIDSDAQKNLQGALQVKMSLDIAAVDKVLDTPFAKQVLSAVSTSIARRDTAGVTALRAAIILGTKSKEGLSIVSFLEAYPSDRLVVDVPAALELASQAKKYSANSSNPPDQDNLSSTPFWRIAISYQRFATKNKQFAGCLFGDSVSAELGNTLGEGNFNFALNGLSAVSLAEQLKLLAPVQVKCQKAVIAVGGNDAWYKLSNDVFVKNLRESIALTRQLGAKQIFLIPGFYSTVAASKDPSISAPNSKVDEINALINQVALAENVLVETLGLQPLNEKGALKEAFATTDGDHLNEEGIKIYRQALFKILK